MKSIFAILLVFTFVQLLNGQSLVVNKNDGSKSSFALTDVKSITFEDISTFTDSRDGKSYKTVKIGNQIWMAENLAYLPSVSPPSAGSATDPYYYVYGYTGTDVAAAKATTNYSTYGVLYNWPAAKVACPKGWHVPSEAEWKTLTSFLGEDVAGYKLKEAGTSHWQSPNSGATNESGFTALPGGLRDYPGNIGAIGTEGIWWTSTEDNPNFSVLYVSLAYNNSRLSWNNTPFTRAWSVRCIKD